jgi:uncharacterized membrane protein YccF (DUF307 family)
MDEQKTVSTEQGAGNTKVKSKTMKILGNVGRFLMYGGWMLLMVVILGIIIAASTCK